MKKIILLITIFFPCLLYLVPTSAFAAKLYLESQLKEAAIGQQFQIALKLDAENQRVNAVESQIQISDNLKMVSLSDGDSIISFWVERPKSTENKISFSGVIPGGYEGVLSQDWSGVKPGNIFEIILEPQAAGQGTISFGNSRVLLNDGIGTPAKLIAEPLSIKIFSGEPKQIIQSKAEDKNPPLAFSPYVGRDSNIFDNHWFVAFETRDLESGIDHYEVLEEYPLFSLNSLFVKPQWVKADSPYLLTDQSLISHIHVKAIDRQGNATIADLEPMRTLPWYENYLAWIIIILVAVAAGLFIRRKFLWKRKVIY